MHGERDELRAWKVTALCGLAAFIGWGGPRPPMVGGPDPYDDGPDDEDGPDGQDDHGRAWWWPWDGIILAYNRPPGGPGPGAGGVAIRVPAVVLQNR